jgi:hypothetical protein
MRAALKLPQRAWREREPVRAGSRSLRTRSGDGGHLVLAVPFDELRSEIAGIAQLAGCSSPRATLPNAALLKPSWLCVPRTITFWHLVRRPCDQLRHL